jgi:hypothetical protein
MTTTRDPVVSAQVLLRPKGGVLPRDADLTAANINAIRPAPEAVAAVTRTFAAAGFEIGVVVGLSFSITARRSAFDAYFGIANAGAQPGEVPLDRVPAAARHAVAAITFPPPPDFGPGSYS